MKTLNALCIASVLSLAVIPSLALADARGDEVAPEAPVSLEDKESVETLRATEEGTVTSLVGCTGLNCNDKDPAANGCTADAQVFRTAWVTYGASYLAKIEGLYSPTCGAQWTRVINWSASPATLEASQYGNSTHYGTRWANNVPTNWSVSSYMMSAGYFFQAYGEWSSGFFNFTTGY